VTSGFQSPNIPAGLCFQTQAWWILRATECRLSPICPTKMSNASSSPRIASSTSLRSIPQPFVSILKSGSITEYE
jgi:hypothetical protein